MISKIWLSVIRKERWTSTSVSEKTIQSIRKTRLTLTYAVHEQMQGWRREPGPTRPRGELFQMLTSYKIHTAALGRSWRTQWPRRNLTSTLVGNEDRSVRQSSEKPVARKAIEIPLPHLSERRQISSHHRGLHVKRRHPLSQLRLANLQSWTRRWRKHATCGDIWSTERECVQTNVLQSKSSGMAFQSIWTPKEYQSFQALVEVTKEAQTQTKQGSPTSRWKATTALKSFIVKIQSRNYIIITVWDMKTTWRRSLTSTMITRLMYTA